MSECLIYQLKTGKTTVGDLESHDVQAEIRLSGSNIFPEHCYFMNDADEGVTLHSIKDSMTMVNGIRIPSDTVSGRFDLHLEPN